MKSFLKRLIGGRRSFRDLGMGETAALSLSKGMRSPADPKRDVNKSLKKTSPPQEGQPVSLGTKERVSWSCLFQLSMLCGVKAIIDKESYLPKISIAHPPI